MQSNFAKRHQTYLSDAFKRDLLSLLTLSDAARTAVAAAAVEELLLTTKEESKAVINRLAERFPDEAATFVGPLNLMEYFAALFADDPTNEPVALDSPEAIAADLSEAGVYPSQVATAKEKFQDALAIVKREASASQGRVRSRVYAAGVLPGLQSIGTTVEARAVFDRDYRFGDDLAEFAPEILETVPVASIKLSFSNADAKTVSFQVNEEELSLLLDQLRATKIELEKLKERAQII